MNQLEQKIDKELEDLGVRPYVIHIRAYGEGSWRRILGSFNSITIADHRKMEVIDVEYIVGNLAEELRREVVRESYDVKSTIRPAPWMMTELYKIGYHGVAICDRRDNFSRKRGRIIAKGRLLKYLRVPELSDGIKW